MTEWRSGIADDNQKTAIYRITCTGQGSNLIVSFVVCTPLAPSLTYPISYPPKNRVYMKLTLISTLQENIPLNN